MVYCLIHENKVIQIEETPFNVAEPLFWKQTNQEVSVGDSYVDDEGAFKAEPLPGITWDDIKTEALSRLAETDWTQLPDESLTDVERNEFAIYRHHVRNVCNEFDSPDQVVWPIKPQVNRGLWT